MPLSNPEVDKELGRLIPLQDADEENNKVAFDMGVVSLVSLNSIFMCKETTKTCTKGLLSWERCLFFFTHFWLWQEFRRRNGSVKGNASRLES